MAYHLLSLLFLASTALSHPRITCCVGNHCNRDICDDIARDLEVDTKTSTNGIQEVEAAHRKEFNSRAAMFGGIFGGFVLLVFIGFAIFAFMGRKQWEEKKKRKQAKKWEKLRLKQEAAQNAQQNVVYVPVPVPVQTVGGAEYVPQNQFVQGEVLAPPPSYERGRGLSSEIQVDRPGSRAEEPLLMKK